MSFSLKKIAVVFVFACMALAGQAFCDLAEAAEQGRVMDDDFGYKGVLLGSSEEEMLASLGEPDYDRPASIFGISVKRYEYGNITVCVAEATQRVVDIELSGDEFQVRDGIRYGSTTYWIHRVYGKQERQKLGNDICYIYTRPGHVHEHLLLRTDSEKGALTSLRITSLPLTEEEADQMTVDGADIEEGLVVEDARFAEKAIDVSALPQAEEPELVLGGAQ